MLNHEINRLAVAGRLQRVKSLPYSKSLEKIRGIIDIDGALFLDFKGNCFAVGAIVDGLAKDPGMPGKGARHNSLYTYGKYLCEKYEDFRLIIAVISEDDNFTIMTGDSLREK